MPQKSTPNSSREMRLRHGIGAEPKLAARLVFLGTTLLQERCPRRHRHRAGRASSLARGQHPAHADRSHRAPVEELERQAARLCHLARPGYDGLEIELSLIWPPIAA
ncbi:MAG: hypothetical protein M3N32_11190 [Actinomycetota bacterium]|nr:hypothetical protein [Actinomycetota bacterium]